MTDRRLLEAALKRREVEFLASSWKRLPHNSPGNPKLRSERRRNLLPTQLNLLQWKPDDQEPKAPGT